MQFSTKACGREAEIAALFKATFTASEGAEEGALIGGLARDLLADTAAEDLYVFLAEDAGVLTGGIFFTRLRYAQDARVVFVLAPVAVATERQGEGIGQALLRHGLAALRAERVDIAITYGDPNYYGKVGFAPLAEADAAAPYRLQFPEGWLGQSLSGAAMVPLKGPSSCVAALANPAYW